MATVSKGRVFVSGETVTPAKLNELVDNATVTAIQTADIADGQITNAKVSDSAAIALSKLATGALPTAITVASANLVDGTIVAADIASGAVTGPKLADGMVVQVVHASTNATTDITANIPSDNTIPQNTEGSEILTATITPSSSTNKVLVSVVVNGTTISAVTYNVALFKDSVANAIAASRNFGEGYTYQSVVQYYDSPATTSAVTYKVRCGANSGTFYLNQNNGDVGLFGGACHSTLTLTEIKAS